MHRRNKLCLNALGEGVPVEGWEELTEILSDLAETKIAAETTAPKPRDTQRLISRLIGFAKVRLSRSPTWAYTVDPQDAPGTQLDRRHITLKRSGANGYLLTIA